jgi:hypothetical protein
MTEATTEVAGTAATEGTAQSTTTQAAGATGAAATDAGTTNSATATAGQTATTTVAIPAASHEEAKGLFASLAAKLENFEHALAADAKAEIEKLKTLLHL